MTIVSIGFFEGGGVVRSDIFLSQESAKWRLRGIGVAESESISTCDFIFLITSFCATPNRCSSSMTRSQSRRNRISSERSLCVPTTTSTVPSFISSRIFLTSFACVMRVSDRTRTQKAPSRSSNVSRCSSARMRRGDITATCTPEITALYTAFMATSVFPNPTSQATSRSMG